MDTDGYLYKVNGTSKTTEALDNEVAALEKQLLELLPELALFKDATSVLNHLIEEAKQEEHKLELENLDLQLNDKQSDIEWERLKSESKTQMQELELHIKRLHARTAMLQDCVVEQSGPLACAIRSKYSSMLQTSAIPAPPTPLASAPEAMVSAPAAPAPSPSALPPPSANPNVDVQMRYVSSLGACISAAHEEVHPAIQKYFNQAKVDHGNSVKLNMSDCCAPVQARVKQSKDARRIALVDPADVGVLRQAITDLYNAQQDEASLLPPGAQLPKMTLHLQMPHGWGWIETSLVGCRNHSIMAHIITEELPGGGLTGEQHLRALLDGKYQSKGQKEVKDNDGTTAKVQSTLVMCNLVEGVLSYHGEGSDRRVVCHRITWLTKEAQAERLHGCAA